MSVFGDVEIPAILSQGGSLSLKFKPTAFKFL